MDSVVQSRAAQLPHFDNTVLLSAALFFITFCFIITDLYQGLLPRRLISIHFVIFITFLSVDVRDRNVSATNRNERTSVVLSYPILFLSTNYRANED